MALRASAGVVNRPAFATAILFLIASCLTNGQRVPIAAQRAHDVPAGVTLGGAFVVNLDADRVRWESTLKQLYTSTMISQTTVGITRVSGVHAANLDLHRFLLDNKLARAAYNDIVGQDRVIGGESLTFGALGCLESHVKAWHQIISLGKPAIVFEDDVTLTGDFDSGLAKALMHLPSDFGLLYLANVIGAPIEKSLKPFDDTLWRMEGGHYGTYAYVMSPSAASTLLNAVYPAYAQVDTIIIDVAKSAHLRVFMSRTPLLSVDNFAGRDSRTQRWAPPPLRLPRVLHTVSLEGVRYESDSDSESVLAAWADLHPTWELMRWNESSLPSSVRLLLSTSNGSPELLDRIVRYELVWRFGGVYVNVAVEPLRSIEPLLLGLDAFVAYESESQLTERIFGAVPHHPLMGRLVARMRMLESTATDVSGPAFITVQVEAALASAPIKAFREFETHIFFPPSPATDDDLLLAYAVRREPPSLLAKLWSWVTSLLVSEDPSTLRESAARARRAVVVSSLSASSTLSASLSSSLAPSPSPSPSPSLSRSPVPSLSASSALSSSPSSSASPGSSPSSTISTMIVPSPSHSPSPSPSPGSSSSVYPSAMAPASATPSRKASLSVTPSPVPILQQIQLSLDLQLSPLITPVALMQVLVGLQLRLSTACLAGVDLSRVVLSVVTSVAPAGTTTYTISATDAENVAVGTCQVSSSRLLADAPSFRVGPPAESGATSKARSLQLTSYTGASMTIFVYVTPSDNAANDTQVFAVKQALAPILGGVSSSGSSAASILNSFFGDFLIAAATASNVNVSSVTLYVSPTLGVVVVPVDVSTESSSSSTILSGGAIAGIVIGCVVFTAWVVFLIVYCARHAKIAPKDTPIPVPQ